MHAFTLLSLNNLARTLTSQGKLDEAETLRTEALAIQSKLRTNNPAK